MFLSKVVLQYYQRLLTASLTGICGLLWILSCDFLYEQKAVSQSLKLYKII